MDIAELELKERQAVEQFGQMIGAKEYDEFI
jgi:hypothetical protein